MTSQHVLTLPEVQRTLQKVRQLKRLRNTSIIVDKIMLSHFHIQGHYESGMTHHEVYRIKILKYGFVPLLVYRINHASSYVPSDFQYSRETLRYRRFFRYKDQIEAALDKASKALQQRWSRKEARQEIALNRKYTRINRRIEKCKNKEK